MAYKLHYSDYTAGASVSPPVPDDVPGGPLFSGQPQPPDVPCDPTGDGWRGPPGPVGPQGPQGVPEAPQDGGTYGRLNGTWSKALPLAGGTMTGSLILAHDPTGLNEAVTKAYADAHSGTGGGAGYLPISGGNMTGKLTVPLLNLAGIPVAKPDGSPPTGAVTGDVYINGGFLCIAP